MLRRVGLLLLATFASGSCVVPEYGIAPGDGSDESGGNTSDGSGGQAPSDGSGGTSSSSGGDEGTGGDESGGTSGDGGTTGAGGSGDGGSGTGGVPPDWSCDEETSHNQEYYSNGTVCGYRYAAFWDGGVIDPECQSGDDSDCFSSTKTFATGEVPASFPDPNDDTKTIYPGILIGMKLAEPYSGGGSTTWPTSGWGVSINYQADGALVPAQVQFTSGGDTYCAVAATGASLAWEDFRYNCYDPTQTSTLHAGDTVSAVEVSLRSREYADQGITRFQLDGINLVDQAPPSSCGGCLELSVPLSQAASGESSTFRLDLGKVGGTDMTNSAARVIFQVLVEMEGTVGDLTAILRDTSGESLYLWTRLGEVTGWYDFLVDVGSLDDETFDAEHVESVSLIIGKGNPAVGETVGDAVVVVESVRFEDVTDGTEGFEFSSDSPAFVLEAGGIAGSGVTWREQ